MAKAQKGSAANKQAALKTTFGAASRLNKIAKQAHDDHQAFDGSWNKFRALNITAHAPNLPDKFRDDFTRAREKIMADGKLINVKVAKLEQLVTQAEALTKLSATLVGSNARRSQQQADDAREAAEKLERQLLDLMNKRMGSEKRGLGGAQAIRDEAAAVRDEAVKLLAEADKLMAAMEKKVGSCVFSGRGRIRL